MSAFFCLRSATTAAIVGRIELVVLQGQAMVGDQRDAVAEAASARRRDSS